MNSIEQQVLFELWNMYKNNIISSEQKGLLKDMLIRKDLRLYTQIQGSLNTNLLQARLLEILHYQGSPRDFENESPVIRKSYGCNTPSTICCFLPKYKQRSRYLSQETIEQIQTSKTRSFSFHNQ